MIIAYKGFDKDLSCTAGGNRFQYELGTWNEETEANCARNGFHCAENPLDSWNCRSLSPIACDISVSTHLEKIQISE